MSRVFPTDNERWAVKISIGNRISRLSNKNRAARKLSILQPVTKKQSLQVSTITPELFRSIVLFMCP